MAKDFQELMSAPLADGSPVPGTVDYAATEARLVEHMATETQSLQELIDAWGKARVSRLAEQKIVDRLEEAEKKLKAQVIAKMKDAKATSMGGLKYGANRDPNKTKPVAGNWQEIYKWIAENDAFDILQKRLTETAVQARIDDGVKIPGIIEMPIDDITMFTV